MSEQERRDPSEAIEEIREKRGEGEEPDTEEQEFLESEKVKLDPEEDTGRTVA